MLKSRDPVPRLDIVFLVVNTGFSISITHFSNMTFELDDFNTKFTVAVILNKLISNVKNLQYLLQQIIYRVT